MGKLDLHLSTKHYLVFGAIATSFFLQLQGMHSWGELFAIANVGKMGSEAAAVVLALFSRNVTTPPDGKLVQAVKSVVGE